MLLGAILLTFIAGMLLVLGMSAGPDEKRPTLKMQAFESSSLSGNPFEEDGPHQKPKKLTFSDVLNTAFLVFKPLVSLGMRDRLNKTLYLADIALEPHTFLGIKIVLMVTFLFFVPGLVPEHLFIFAIFMSLAVGYMLPEIWLKGKVKKIKDDMVRFLPDTVDLLGLCVSAGLDFMMALKWVVDKSHNNVVTREMGILLREISVGKPRREALRDMAKKYDLPDLSTFARTLIQADKMGTSVSEALNILSEDMRLARFRRGEAVAMKAPLKMLVPLLFCIFPVVGILVGGPIFLDFMMNNPMQGLGG